MKYYRDFSPSGESFEDRIGSPDALDAAIGRIALEFSYLEDTATNTVILLSGTEEHVGRLLTVDQSFRQKVDAIGALTQHHLAGSQSEPVKPATEEEALEILFLCRRAEQLRNTYLHSSYSGNIRVKATAKGRRGPRVVSEAVTASLLLDVADFIGESASLLEGLPLVLGLADIVGGALDRVVYTKNGKVLREFSFPKGSSEHGPA